MPGKSCGEQSIKGETKVKLKRFVDTYCSVLSTSSMLRTGTYHAYDVISHNKGDAVAIFVGSTAILGEITVVVCRLAKNTVVASKSKISQPDQMPLDTQAELRELPLNNKFSFDQDGRVSFAINGKLFSFSADTTLQSMISSITADVDANVTMMYSASSDSIQMSADSGGAASKIVIENMAGNTFGLDSALGIDMGVTANGSDCLSVINDIEVKCDSNSFTMGGITFHFGDVTEGTSDEIHKFVVVRNCERPANAIAKFVESLNNLIAGIPSAAPADEKDEKLLDTIRNAFSQPAGGTEKRLDDIGIFYDAERNAICMDRQRLLQALENDAEEVANMFTWRGGEHAGIVHRVKESILWCIGIPAGVKSEQEEKNRETPPSATLENKLRELSERYYEKFVAMNDALDAFNMQSEYLKQLFFD